MIKYTNCSVKDIERQLNLQLEYDPESTVISIVPIKFTGGPSKPYRSGEIPGLDFDVTDVKIIWDSR